MQHKLYALRKESSMSQSDVARALGITPKTYGMKERGDTPFDSDEMFKLAKLFRKPMDDIFLPRSHQIGNKSKEA
ncbi:helix-turn-helix domain-containing protein [Secundilactobacillus kimchicus]|uniref:helix-turn-helix transcriptional regulator n=1 Tax=Secundilactobacillus kimchicus TaxID=528209 RepID=UPI000704F83B|nr:helix-turn-helix domain-containing protein [Secundilactobacillus kimchicus]MBT9671791.1 helix-turn-helix domain-containing protein [Secundilactobacillus kimchicus]